MTLRESASTGSLASLARECVQQRRPTTVRATAGRNHTKSFVDVAEGTVHRSGMDRDPFQQLMFQRAILSSRYVNSSSGSPPLGVTGTSGLLGGTTRAGKRISAVRSTGNLKSASSSSTHSLTGHRHGHGVHVPQSAQPSNSALVLEAAAAPSTPARKGLAKLPTNHDPTACKASVRICEAECDGNGSMSVASASTPLLPPSGEHNLEEVLEVVETIEACTPLPPSGERILAEALEAAGMLQAKGPTTRPYGSRLENKPLGLPLRHRSCSLTERHRVMGTSPENGFSPESGFGHPRFVWGDWDQARPARQLRQAKPPPSAASPLSSENLQAHELQQHNVVQRRTSRERRGGSQMDRDRSVSSLLSLHSDKSSRSSRKQQSTASATSLSRSLPRSKTLSKEARSASQPMLQRPTWSELVAEGERLGASLRAQVDQHGRQPHEPDVQNSCR